MEISREDAYRPYGEHSVANQYKRDTADETRNRMEKNHDEGGSSFIHVCKLSLAYWVAHSLSYINTNNNDKM